LSRKEALTAPHHRYFVAWPDCSAPIVEVPGPVWRPELVPETRYPLAVLAEAQETIATPGLHFYLTKDPDRLPEYGPHVVVVLIEEERCKIPAYARHIRAVIRDMQTYPFPGFRLHASMGSLEAVLLFEYLRDWMTHLRSRIRLARFNPGISRVTDQPRIFTIPLGYHSQKELPLVPMRERTLDSFFSGDVRSHFTRNDYRYWTSTSKILARQQLWRALEQLPTSLSGADGAWKILRNEITTETAAADPAAFGGYSERMQQSRICLAPRGSVAETFRLFEGLRSGCLVMTNRLPPVPFLAGAPVVYVDHWKQLPALLRKYARDFDALEQASRASRRWWDEHCSEAVIGKQIADALNQL